MLRFSRALPHRAIDASIRGTAMRHGKTTEWRVLNVFHWNPTFRFPPLGGHYMLLLVRVKRSEIHSDTAPEAFVLGRQCCHGSVGCAHVNSPLGFTGGGN